MITFDQINLATETISREFSERIDVILCRNVLMYFDPKIRNRAISRICESLADSGWLAVSPSEVHFVRQCGLKSVRFPEMILHRKIKNGAQAITNWAGTHEWKRILSIGRSPTKPKCALNELFADARHSYSMGDYNGAAKKLLKLLDAFPPVTDGSVNESDALLLLAKCMLRLGKPDDAARWCELAANSVKPDIECHYLLSTVYKEIGCFDKAFETLQQTVAMDPSFPLGHFALGHLEKLVGRRQAAVRHLTRALDLLAAMEPDTILPHGDGISAATLADIIRTLLAGRDQLRP